MSTEDKTVNNKSSWPVVDAVEFFPGVNEDLSLVSWAHAVNSVAKLKDALEDDKIMMLEADVSAGQLEGDEDGGKDDIIPIMAHPPHTRSDLSLAAWIKGIIEANKDGKKKGAKLDFKDLSIVKESLEMLYNQVDSINFPLWLNADILKGPVEAKDEPIDQEQFLTLCMQYFPQATLSVGWKTRFTSADDEKAEYTKGMAEEMAAVLEAANVTQPVTFPIRATFVSRSLEALEWLVDTVPDSTITIWSPVSEPFDPQAIIALQDSVGMDCVYLDLPEAERKAVDDARARETSSGAKGYRFIPPAATAMVASAGLALASALAALYLYE